MLKLEKRGVVVLTEDQVSLIAGGATVKVGATKKLSGPFVKRAAADTDGDLSECCPSSDPNDSQLCASDTCDSEACASDDCQTAQGVCT